MPDAQPVRGLRASDADRDEVVTRLGEEFAAGRLSHDTFLFRMNAVLQARHQSDLPRVLADLPGTPGQSPPARSRRIGPARRLTGAMRRAGAHQRRPVPLQFPRGADTAFIVGRAAGCDLTIADMTVSRAHARLERTPDGWLLCDLASTNGTRVNGWLVRGKVPVRAGDLVSFGSAEFWLSAAAEGT